MLATNVHGVRLQSHGIACAWELISLDWFQIPHTVHGIRCINVYSERRCRLQCRDHSPFMKQQEKTAYKCIVKRNTSAEEKKNASQFEMQSNKLLHFISAFSFHRPLHASLSPAIFGVLHSRPFWLQTHFFIVDCHFALRASLHFNEIVV